jgi:hypothetical protein
MKLSYYASRVSQSTEVAITDFRRLIRSVAFRIALFFGVILVVVLDCVAIQASIVECVACIQVYFISSKSVISLF